MTNLEPQYGQIVDDPSRPYKAYAAMVAAAIVALLDLGLPMPNWLTAALMVVGAGAAAYVKGNPKKHKRLPDPGKDGKRRR